MRECILIGLGFMQEMRGEVLKRSAEQLPTLMIAEETTGTAAGMRLQTHEGGGGEDFEFPFSYLS